MSSSYHHCIIIILIIMTIVVTAIVQTKTGFQINIFHFRCWAGITAVATKTHPVHKSILNLVPRLFLCKFVIYDPGSIWGEKYVISHNAGFNVIWGGQRNTVEIQLLCGGEIQKYVNTAQCGCLWRVLGLRDILRDTNFYKLCFMPFATHGRFRLPY